MRFSKDFPDELRSQIFASDVVGKKVALKKKGKEFGGLCPFHNEKTPSFTVNDQKGFYHCFGCGAHGDIISFVMQKDGLDFKEAVIRLAGDFGVEIPYLQENQNSEEEKEQEEKIARDYLILEKTCQFFEKNLSTYTGMQALDYAKKRGLGNDVIKKFRLGFAPDSYESLINYLKADNFSEAELLASGVIAKNDSKKLYDKFRNRLIFPITNKKGKVIAFGGRAMGDSQPKYLNSSETKLFKKGQNLYNYSFARKEIFEKKFAVVVEGYMDVISLAQNGIENVVAPLGTALTIDQMQELFKITSDVVLCLDGDNAGINAMRRSIDISLPIISAKNNIRFAFIPGGMDPDDFLKANGKSSMQNLLQNAQNLSEVLFDYEAKELGLIEADLIKIAPEKKVQLETRLMQKINLISDQNSKKYFLQYYKDRLFNFGKNKNNKDKNITSSNIVNIASNLDTSSIYAQNIITLLVQFPELINHKSEFGNVRETHFENEELENLKEEIIDFFDHNSKCKSADIILHLENFFIDKNSKNKFFLNKNSSLDLEKNKIKLEIFLLKYYHEQVSLQCLEMLARIDNVETDEISIKEGQQKKLFDHKIFLEKKILQLVSESI